MVVTGVRFLEGPPGSRELCFKYLNFEEFVRVKVTAGPPTKITLLAGPELVNISSFYRNVLSSLSYQLLVPDPPTHSSNVLPYPFPNSVDLFTPNHSVCIISPARHFHMWSCM